jgi:NTP pyrophosphatase (non-canonical NTP hydrolase)
MLEVKDYEKDWQKAIMSIHRFMCRTYEVGSLEDQRCLAVGLGGEVGEFLNLIKKSWRGDKCDHTQETEDELADVIFYTYLLAKTMNLDIDEICESKAAVWVSRWPEAKEALIHAVGEETLAKWTQNRQMKSSSESVKKKIKDYEFLIGLLMRELSDCHGESFEREPTIEYKCHYCNTMRHDKCNYHFCECNKLDHINWWR